MYVNNYMMTTDVHVSGAPLRIFHYQTVKKAYPSMRGYLEELNQPSCKIVWKRLLEEPRGHNNMVLCIVTPPISPGADAGLLFRNTNGDTSVPVHGLIGIATVLAETGYFRKEDYSFDCINGQYHVHVDFDNESQKAVQVRVKQTLTLGLISDKELQFETITWRLNKDTIIVLPAEHFNVTLTIEDLNRIKSEAENFFRRLSNHGEKVSHILLYQKNTENRHMFLTIDKEGYIDRSPLSGAGAFATYLDNIGLASGQKRLTVSNFLGHQATVEFSNIQREGLCSTYTLAVGGQGFITGFHRFVVDQTDPLKDGFLIK
ncbi:hypothetical protein EWH99_07820 [Sporolactobacillus sp. THM7-7]|nr:hypothetical protein EWH99_07820 [Sporolactobacillus sp. THM7-7]